MNILDLRLRRLACGLFFLDGLVDLLAVYGYVLRCFYSQPHLISPYVDNNNPDIIAYYYRLVFLPA